MAFTFDIDPALWFAERSRQFEAWGIPRRVIRTVRRSVEDPWREGPGGWAFEWTRVAQDAERESLWLRAAACYGAARFPCASTPLRERAAERQLDCFLRAAPFFRCHFERRTLHLPHGDGVTAVPVHVYEPRSRTDPRERSWPVLLLSGGVDTFKIELHRLAMVLARGGPFTVVAMDMPGTGESELSLDPQAHRIYAAVLERLKAARGLGTRVGMMGVSFGGHWATRLAMDGQLRAAVNLGGPIGMEVDGHGLAELPNGMSSIVANAMGMSAVPEGAALDDLLRDFSLREIIGESTASTPLLVVNGAEDVYVPTADVEVFHGRPGATVWQVAGAGHCAAERLRRIVPGILTWLRLELHGTGVRNRLLHAAGRALLPPRVERSAR